MGKLDKYWKGFHLVSLETPGDGNCLIHAFLAAFSKTYQEGNKSQVAKEVRNELAIELRKKYNLLYDGNLKAFSDHVSDFSFESMLKLLEDTKAYLGHGFFQLISLVFEMNIFIFNVLGEPIINFETKYYTSFLNGPSVLILFENNHFETIVLEEGNKRTSVFKPDHELILELRKHLEKAILQNEEH
jgi:hypothetical protein